MPVPRSANGGFAAGNSFTSPYTDSNTLASLGSFPAGSYGLGARLLLIVAGRTGQLAASPHQAFTLTMTGGNVTVYPLSLAINGNLLTPLSGDVNNYALGAWVVEPSGWSFDSGSTVRITAQKQTAFLLSGTLSVSAGSKSVTGVGTQFTTELAIVNPGAFMWTGGAFFNSFGSVIDNTHMLLQSNASTTVTNAQVTVTPGADMLFIWGLLTFATTPLPGAGVITTLSGNPAPQYADGNGITWSNTSFSGPFGIYTDGSGTTFNAYLGDTSIVEAFAVLAGIGPGPHHPDLTGSPNWTTISGTSGNTKSFAGMAVWTRPLTLDTTMSWSDFPASSFGHGFVVLFPTSLVIVTHGHSFAQVIG